jgi:hypothetical protein
MKISALGEDALWELSVFLEYEDGHINLSLSRPIVNQNEISFRTLLCILLEAK